MTMHEYLFKAIQDDAQRAGERDRLLLEIRRSRPPRRYQARAGVLATRVARLLRRAPTPASGPVTSIK